MNFVSSSNKSKIFFEPKNTTSKIIGNIYVTQLLNTLQQTEITDLEKFVIEKATHDKNYRKDLLRYIEDFNLT